MSAIARHGRSPFRAPDWQPEALQRMDEQHLVAWSAVPGRRVAFGAAFTEFLALQRDAELCVLYGHSIVDLETLCAQLERSLPGPELSRRIEGLTGVVAWLRSRSTGRFRHAAKFRYYLWHDADVLLKHDAELFGRLVDAIAGVSAEAEYVSDEMLLIHRAVIVGSPALAEYGARTEGQFRSWFDDGLGRPFWLEVTGVPTPRVEIAAIEDLMR
ncbi:MAG: hypothetical protein FJ255_00975 [Phycisphaerae bacterium]|nr:hypothetical protein [Phycisphaerae bacterium]